MKKTILVIVLFTIAFVGIKDFLVPYVNKQKQEKAIKEYLDNQNRKYFGKPEPGIDTTLVWKPGKDK